jgi:hypothetical protein
MFQAGSPELPTIPVQLAVVRFDAAAIAVNEYTRPLIADLAKHIFT